MRWKLHQWPNGQHSLRLIPSKSHGSKNDQAYWLYWYWLLTAVKMSYSGENEWALWQFLLSIRHSAADTMEKRITFIIVIYFKAIWNAWNKIITAQSLIDHDTSSLFTLLYICINRYDKVQDFKRSGERSSSDDESIAQDHQLKENREVSSTHWMTAESTAQEWPGPHPHTCP